MDRISSQSARSLPSPRPRYAGFALHLGLARPSPPTGRPRQGPCSGAASRRRRRCSHAASCPPTLRAARRMPLPAARSATAMPPPGAASRCSRARRRTVRRARRPAPAPRRSRRRMRAATIPHHKGHRTLQSGHGTVRREKRWHAPLMPRGLLIARCSPTCSRRPRTSRRQRALRAVIVGCLCRSPHRQQWGVRWSNPRARRVATTPSHSRSRAFVRRVACPVASCLPRHMGRSREASLPNRCHGHHMAPITLHRRRHGPIVHRAVQGGAPFVAFGARDGLAIEEHVARRVHRELLGSTDALLCWSSPLSHRVRSKLWWSYREAVSIYAIATSLLALGEEPWSSRTEATECASPFRRRSDISRPEAWAQDFVRAACAGHEVSHPPCRRWTSVVRSPRPSKQKF